MRYTLLIAAAAIGGLMTPGSVEAYWGSGAGIGIGGLYRSLDYPTDRRVPYFAAHPPVYYSRPVPRTYGYSPFAYTPDTRTPDVASSCQPVEIINPYVPSSAKTTPKSATPKQQSTRGRTISNSKPVVKAIGPMTIINPYVVSGGRTI